jgi:1,4-dihydroxy-2-naphthoyl-CoA hydrolase
MTDTPAAAGPRDDASDPIPGTPPAADGADPADALTQVRASLTGTLMERMGIEVLEAGPQRVVGTMPVAGNTQPYGLLHGGASVVLAETLGSYGAMLHAGPGRQAVGIEVSASHHRGATDGVVTGTARAVHLGGTTAVYEIVVEDSRSRRVCTARLTCLLIARRAG